MRLMRSRCKQKGTRIAQRPGTRVSIFQCDWSIQEHRFSGRILLVPWFFCAEASAALQKGSCLFLLVRFDGKFQ